MFEGSILERGSIQKRTFHNVTKARRRKDLCHQDSVFETGPTAESGSTHSGLVPSQTEVLLVHVGLHKPRNYMQQNSKCANS